MINISMKLPDHVAIAVSGGPDSMAALDFLSRKKSVLALHFNHKTSHSDMAEHLVSDYCAARNIPLAIGELQVDMPPNTSREDFWRKQRYEFFEWAAVYQGKDLPVITCHHLDDVIETWLFTSIHGDPRLIPSKRGRYLRPFLTTRKAIFEDWCDRKGVPYIIDPSNTDISFMRNYIRHELMPHALRINPGLSKVLRKKIKKNPVIFNDH